MKDIDPKQLPPSLCSPRRYQLCQVVDGGEHFCVETAGTTGAAGFEVPGLAFGPAVLQVRYGEAAAGEGMKGLLLRPAPAAPIHSASLWTPINHPSLPPPSPPPPHTPLPHPLPRPTAPQHLHETQSPTTAPLCHFIHALRSSPLLPHGQVYNSSAFHRDSVTHTCSPWPPCATQPFLWTPTLLPLLFSHPCHPPSCPSIQQFSLHPRPSHPHLLSLATQPPSGHQPTPTPCPSLNPTHPSSCPGIHQLSLHPRPNHPHLLSLAS